MFPWAGRQPRSLVIRRAACCRRSVLGGPAPTWVEFEEKEHLLPLQNAGPQPLATVELEAAQPTAHETAGP